jgi:hypothetical protein
VSKLCQSFADFRDNSGSLGVSTASWAWDSALIEGPKGTPGTPGTPWELEVTHHMDPVPHVPPEEMGFQHLASEARQSPEEEVL